MLSVLWNLFLVLTLNTRLTLSLRDHEVMVSLQVTYHEIQHLIDPVLHELLDKMQSSIHGLATAH